MLTIHKRPEVGHLNRNSQLSSNAPPMPGIPPQQLNIDRCIICRCISYNRLPPLYGLLVQCWITCNPDSITPQMHNVHVPQLLKYASKRCCSIDMSRPRTQRNRPFAYTRLCSKKKFWESFGHPSLQ